jgi:gluconolactonase
MVDIPFRRIFRVSPEENWSLLIEYDGWPNGLKCTPEGRIVFADHRQGLVKIMENGEVVVLLSGYRGERFRGFNDLTLSSDS